MYASAKCEYSYPFWLRIPGETSPEVQNRGISGPNNGHVSTKIYFKKSCRFKTKYLNDVFSFLVLVQQM